MPQSVLVVFPTQWDLRQLARTEAVRSGRMQVELTEPPDAECRWDLDLQAFVHAATRRAASLDGVFSSSDYPGAQAAAMIARRAGLPGAPPQAVLRASHKYLSRVAQREALPEITPRFELMDPDDPRAPAFGFPCFVKPVKASFSMFAQRLDGMEDLERLFASPELREFRACYVDLFDRLLAWNGITDASARHFVAEELLTGQAVTVEGFVAAGRPRALGVVDSILHANGAFERFEYPSSLSPEVQARMEDVACRLAAHLGLDDTLFNVEMTWDAARDALRVIEVNPRACGQFGDLYEKVDGVNSFDVALSLAVGRRPATVRRAGAFAHSASVPLRAFEPVSVLAAPGEQAVREVERAVPGAVIWIECATGDVLADFALQDGKSHRYAVVNLGGTSRADVARKLERVKDELAFRFAPV